MRLLVDQNISPKVTRALTAMGHDALDTRDLNMQATPDESYSALTRKPKLLAS